ncbi:putative carbonic anhydrase protein [Botrytis fragariae]|uniref:Carbonic anhydrase n=1 Tax=Botrytis fragariae TaxID=1964551 RepID=A0A8H6B2N1_9HELO|nr:putative carbonic anhydrase protein [Botrytis fragariae]KAF5878241.1 putative carbonic anhydrase protein [Botrytis fragariae]
MPAEVPFTAAAATAHTTHSETPIQKNLIESNKLYAANFTQGDLALPPAKKYAVVTCMDARIGPSAAFGIALGDAHVIRNAGGSARDALRSLVISQKLLGTNEILLVKHTGCGMLTFGNEDVVKLVEERLGEGAKKELDAFGGEFLPFADLEEEVRRDVEWLRGVEVIPENVGVSGWVYEVESGKVKRVV